MEDRKIMIYMGNGHGKSAAALGMALRYASKGKKVAVIQFLKAKDYLDKSITQRLEPEIKFFRFERADEDYLERSPREQEEDALNMRNGLGFARKVLATRMCDLLILDEVLEVVNKGIISVEELRDAVKVGEETDVIITGEEMDIEVCNFADEITQIRPMQYWRY